MNIVHIQPVDLGSKLIADKPFDPLCSAVPFHEADQTYSNGGVDLVGFNSVRSEPAKTQEGLLPHKYYR